MLSSGCICSCRRLPNANNGAVRFTKGNGILIKGDCSKVHWLVNPTYSEPEYVHLGRLEKLSFQEKRKAPLVMPVPKRTLCKLCMAGVFCKDVRNVAAVTHRKLLANSD